MAKKNNMVKGIKKFIAKVAMKASYNKGKIDALKKLKKVKKEQKKKGAKVLLKGIGKKQHLRIVVRQTKDSVHIDVHI